MPHDANPDYELLRLADHVLEARAVLGDATAAARETDERLKHAASAHQSAIKALEIALGGYVEFQYRGFVFRGGGTFDARIQVTPSPPRLEELTAGHSAGGAP